MAIKPAERLMNLLLALTNTTSPLGRERIQSGVQGYDPKANPEAFERMFERDKKELRSLGIDVETVYDAMGSAIGYRVSPGWTMPELRFDASEMALLAVASRVWEQASLGAAAINGLRKLEVAGDATATIAGPIARAGGSDEGFGAFLEVIRERRVAVFDYRAPNRPDPTGAVRRRVQTWGLVLWEGVWYAVGHDLDRDAVRSFRLSRVVGRPKGEGPAAAFEVPTGLSLRELVGNFAPPSDVAFVHVATGRGHDLRRRALSETENPDGSARLKIAVDHEASLVGRIAALGPNALVEGPEHLRSEVLRRLRGAAEPPPDTSVPGERLVGPSDGSGNAQITPPTKAGQKPKAGQKAKQSGQGAGGAEAASGHLARLLALMPWITRHSPVSMAQTAEHFGITEVQLERDLGLLSLSGLPGYEHADLIDIEYWETGGMIRVHNAQNMARPVRLTPLEVAALVSALRMISQIPGEIDRDALERLAQRLQESASKASTAAEVDVRIDVPEGVAVLEHAIAQQRALRLTYLVASRDEVTDRVVDPVEFLVLSGVTYLWAWCRSAQANRTFRLDRIIAASALDEPAVLPADIARPEGRPSGHTLEVVLEAEGRWVVEKYATGPVRDLGQGRMHTVIEAGSAQWAIGLGLAMGGAGWIIKPESLASMVGAQAREALARYAEGPSASA